MQPSSGSVSVIFELVFPPPKFVMRRSEPKKIRAVPQQFGIIQRARDALVPAIFQIAQFFLDFHAKPL